MLPHHGCYALSYNGTAGQLSKCCIHRFRPRDRLFDSSFANAPWRVERRQRRPLAGDFPPVGESACRNRGSERRRQGRLSLRPELATAERGEAFSTASSRCQTWTCKNSIAAGISRVFRHARVYAAATLRSRFTHIVADETHLVRSVAGKGSHPIPRTRAHNRVVSELIKPRF